MPAYEEPPAMPGGIYFFEKSNDDPIQCNSARRQQEDAAMYNVLFRLKMTGITLSKKA